MKFHSPAFSPGPQSGWFPRSYTLCIFPYHLTLHLSGVLDAAGPEWPWAAVKVSTAGMERISSRSESSIPVLAGCHQELMALQWLSWPDSLPQAFSGNIKNNMYLRDVLQTGIPIQKELHICISCALCPTWSGVPIQCRFVFEFVGVFCFKVPRDLVPWDLK